MLKVYEVVVRSVSVLGDIDIFKCTLVSQLIFLGLFIASLALQTILRSRLDVLLALLSSRCCKLKNLQKIPHDMRYWWILRLITLNRNFCDLSKIVLSRKCSVTRDRFENWKPTSWLPKFLKDYFLDFFRNPNFRCWWSFSMTALIISTFLTRLCHRFVKNLFSG